jgi:hypothetical protein
MGDRFESLSANQLPGARDIISSETDLLKAQAKASHTGPDESATALEALAQRAEEVIPGMGDKVRAFGGTNKGLGAARDYVHQQLGQKFSNEQGILNRTNTTAKNEDTNRVANEQKDLSYLKDLGNTVKPEIVQAAGAIKRLKSMVAEGEAKYGPGNIPGVGILSAALSGHPTTAALMEKFGLTSSDANRFREEANLINVLQRHEITGAAFSKQEASEIRQLMANITSGNATQRTLDRLEELVHTALNKAYASHPTVAGKFIKSMGPDAETEQFNLNSPAEPSPQMQSITPDVAKARGVNPAGFMPPPVVPKSEVREPSGKIAPAPPGSAEIPTAQEPPPQKPGKLTMQLPDGRFVYSDPSKVEWVKAKFPGSKPIKYVLKK